MNKHLKDHARTCKWFVTPFIGAMKFGHLEGVPQPDP